jgi:4-hydroxybenzoyl-CoA thioesterase
MSFSRAFTVNFGQCDPAGIVFYPRYFEMLNATVEAFFAEALQYSFVRIHCDERCGVPTVHLEVDFRAPSRLGDAIVYRLRVTRVGRTSATLETRVGCGEELRLTARQVIVWTTPGPAPAPWPEQLSRALEAHRIEDDAQP